MNRERLRRNLGILKKNKDFKSFLHEILSQCNSNDVERFYNECRKDKKISQMLNMSYFPEKLSDLSKGRFWYGKTSTEVLLIWFKRVLTENELKINKYINLKLEYESYVLNAKFTEALKKIEEIERENGVSFWIIEQKMIMNEKLFGVEANKGILKAFQDETSSNPFIGYLMRFSSQIAEEKLSYSSYQDIVSQDLKTINDINAFRYIDYKINLDYIHNLENTNVILQFEGQLSLIDIYELIIHLAQLEIDESSIFGNVLVELSKYINDKRIVNLLVYAGLFDKDNFNITSCNEKEFLTLIDIYTSGNYERSHKELLAYKDKNSVNFQFIILYVKTLVNLGIKEESDSDIQNVLYNLYSMNLDFEKISIKLKNLYKMYSSLSFMYKLKNLIIKKLDLVTTENGRYLSIINDTLVSPSFFQILPKSEIRDSYLDTIKEFAPITSELYGSRVLSFLKKDTVVEIIRKNIFLADALLEEGEQLQALNALIKIYNEIEKYNLYLRERIISRLFKVYLLLGMLTEASSLLVREYFKDKNLIRRLEKEDLVNRIKKCKEVELKRDINAVIAAYISNEPTRVIFSNYLYSNNISNTEDMLNNDFLNNDFLNKIFFLENICSLKTIKRETTLSITPEDAEVSRINILEKLININPTFEKKYREEIAILMRVRNIRNKIKEIEGSKITVDTDMIKKDSEIIFEEQFQYIQLFNDFEANSRPDELYLGQLKKAMDDTVVKKKMNDSNFNGIVDSMKKFVERVLHEFLFNYKYGLKTHVSARIRHGYLESQLTDLFFEHGLMGCDIDNPITQNCLGNAISEELEKFSSNIGIIVNRLKDEWLQVKMKSTDVGLFDYSDFTSKNVHRYVTLMKIDDYDYDAFYKDFVDDFWVYTENILDKLKEKIKTELHDTFHNELDSLENNLRNIEVTYISEDRKKILGSINICRAQYQDKIIEFSKVFNRNEISYNDFFVKDAVETAIEIVSNMFSKFRKVKIEKYIEDTTVIQGKYFPYFIDIFVILINNSLLRSGFKDEEKLIIEIDLSVNNNITESEEYFKSNKSILKNTSILLNFKIKNNLDKEIDNIAISKKIDEILKNLKDKEVLKYHAQEEGGSGIYKIANMLKSNVFAPYHLLPLVDDEYFSFELILGLDDIVV